MCFILKIMLDRCLAQCYHVCTMYICILKIDRYQIELIFFFAQIMKHRVIVKNEYVLSRNKKCL